MFTQKSKKFATKISSHLKKENYKQTHIPVVISIEQRKKKEKKKICLLDFYTRRAIGQMSRVFVNGPGDRGSILGQVTPKTQKMVLDTALLNTHHDKVQIKGKVEQSKELSRALPYTSV